MHRLTACGVLVLQIGAQPVPPRRAEAQDASSGIPRGRIVEHVASRSDTNLRYALYLPSSFTIERSWPVALLLDPRGRALVPLRPVVDAAERFGWVMTSRYDTRSDVDPRFRRLVGRGSGRGGNDA